MWVATTASTENAFRIVSSANMVYVVIGNSNVSSKVLRYFFIVLQIGKDMSVYSF